MADETVEPLATNPIQVLVTETQGTSTHEGPPSPPLQPAGSPPSAPGIQQPEITPPTPLVATIKDGSTSALGWGNIYHLQFASAPPGTSINSNGDLVFSKSSTWNPQLSIMVQTPLAAHSMTIRAIWDNPPNASGPPAGSYTDINAFTFGTTPINMSGAIGGQGKVLALGIQSDSADTFLWTGGTVTVLLDLAVATFPDFTPIIPTSTPPGGVGQIGEPVATPNFPPPTPPPIGHVPVGPLVGPAVAPAPVPPSTAGFPLIRFTFGSATTPPASAAFPEFTTGSPSPPIVVTQSPGVFGIFTGGSPPITPPSTPTPTYITIDGLGPPIGPALPNPIPPRTFMAEAGVVSETTIVAHENGPRRRGRPRKHLDLTC